MVPYLDNGISCMNGDRMLRHYSFARRQGRTELREAGQVPIENNLYTSITKKIIFIVKL